MLAFLESLSKALMARDADLIRRLLDHPLAHALPRHVRDEADGVASGSARSFAAPLQTLHLYHQTAHLLGACADPALRPDQRTRVVAPTAPSTRASQMELSLGRAGAR